MTPQPHCLLSETVPDKPSLAKWSPHQPETGHMEKFSSCYCRGRGAELYLLQSRYGLYLLQSRYGPNPRCVSICPPLPPAKQEPQLVPRWVIICNAFVAKELQDVWVLLPASYCLFLGGFFDKDTLLLYRLTVVLLGWQLWPKGDHS